MRNITQIINTVTEYGKEIGKYIWGNRENSSCSSVPSSTPVVQSTGTPATSHPVCTEVPKEEIEWYTYHDLEINAKLFEKGIVAIRAYNATTSSKTIIDKNNFTFGSNTLCFGSTKEKLGRLKSQLEKTKSERNQWEEKNKKKQSNELEKDKEGKNIKETSYLRTMRFLDELENFCQSGTPGTDKEIQTLQSIKERNIIYNKNRREEILFQITVEHEKQKKLGFYIYPWQSSNKVNFDFSGINQFVMAGCIFGSSIKGIDEHEGVYDLIKHDIQFYKEQKIARIECNQINSSPYEIMLFSEFENLAPFMKKLGKREEKTQLYYHLPYYDYILFGVELFIRGRITFSALDAFFKAVLSRKQEHQQKIKDICKKNNIEVQIESPFENLFGNLPAENPTKYILTELGLSEEEIKPDAINEDIQKQNETRLVQNCLKKLKTYNKNPEHRQIWEDFLKLPIVNKTQEITNLEALFKIANAVMIARACKGKKDYQTCALYPLSEKQIQVQYATLSTGLNEVCPKQYPCVLNITHIDPMVAYRYTAKNEGLLFYYRGADTQASKLITKHGILETAHLNIGSSQPTKIGTVLSKVKSNVS